jgi:hypothetical protein
MLSEGRVIANESNRYNSKAGYVEAKVGTEEWSIVNLYHETRECNQKLPRYLVALRAEGNQT